MKKILLLLILIMFMSCGKKEITREDLVLKDGVPYVSKTNKKFSGELKEFYENKNLKSVITYEDGVRVLFKSFYEDGVLSEEFNKKEGYAKNFYRNGNIKRNLKMNEKEVETFYENGEIDQKVEILSHDPFIREGKYISYHSNGKVREEGNYKKDKREGLWYSRTTTGLLESKGYYLNGLKTGEWQFVKNGDIYYVDYIEGRDIAKKENEAPAKKNEASAKKNRVNFREIAKESLSEKHYIKYTETNISKNKTGYAVYFQLPQNFNNKMRVSSAYSLTSRFMKKLSKSSGYDSVGTIRMIFVDELVDVYGNKTKRDVIDLVLSPETRKKINWENFNYENFPFVADEISVHPSLKK